MSEFVIPIGQEREDGQFLLHGFSPPIEIQGRRCRSCAQEFALRLPAAKSGGMRIELTIFIDDPEMEVRFFTGKTPLLTVNASKPEWSSHSFDTPADVPTDDGFVILRGEASKDPALPPPEDSMIAKKLALAEVCISSLGGEAIEAPAKATMETICQFPFKVPAMYRPYHEGHKMRPLFGDRLWKFQYSGEKEIYFGDPHVHTNYSRCGHGANGNIDENVRMAKERGHDFIAITDHAEHIDPKNWERYFEEVREAGRKHDVLTIPAVEWTSYEHGHRNVYFLDETIPPYFSSRTFETHHPARLRDFIRKHGLRAFVAPHHPAYISHLTDFGSVQQDMEPLVEIYSTWGSSECHGAALQDTHNTMPGGYVQDALARGLKFGFLAGGDAHNTMAGDTGLTGVVADSLTLENIWHALRNRLCYATAGDRILLDFHLNGFPMGRVIRVNQYSINNLFPIHIAASAICPTPFKRIDLICNGVVIYSHTQRDRKTEVDLRVTYERNATPDRIEAARTTHLVNVSRYYYVRVEQCDGGMAWSSPIWIDYEFAWR